MKHTITIVIEDPDNVIGTNNNPNTDPMTAISEALWAYDYEWSIKFNG